MNSRLVFAFIALAFTFSACEKEDGVCSKVEVLGSFSLLTESKTALPYNDTQSRVIFSDSIGQERALNIVKLSEGFVSQEFTARCLSDSSVLAPYSWEPEKICYELQDEATGSFSYRLCLEMQYNIYQPEQKQVADLLHIEAYSSSSRLQLEGNYDILLSPRNFNGQVVTAGTLELLDQFSWKGRTLPMVYRLQTVNADGFERELYYTKAEGLVAFQDYFSDTFYFFERIE